MDSLTSEQIGSIIGAVCTGSLLGGGFIIGLILRIFPWQKNAKRATSEQKAVPSATDITDTMQGRDLDATKNALVVVSNTLGKAQDQLEASQAQLKESQAQLTEAQAEIEASKAGRAADKVAREQLASQMKTLQISVNNLTIEKESRESTITALREEIAEKDSRIAQLEQQYETACEDIIALFDYVRKLGKPTDEMPVLKTHVKPKTGPLGAPKESSIGIEPKPLQEGDN